MMMVSGPELVASVMKSGLMAALPAHNARNIEEFDQWLADISSQTQSYAEQNPDAIIGPLAVNITARRTLDELDAYIALCEKHHVKIIISAMGNPGELAKKAHGAGARIFHDITTIAHAEKAVAAGVDGLICIGYGGGGHSGRLSHLVLIPKIRSFFNGTVVLAGCASNGAAIRAAEILGADLCYLGTRFIAVKESRAPLGYKRMIIAGSSSDLTFTDKVSGVSANWLTQSLLENSVDVESLMADPAPGKSKSIPESARPWKDIWSAGQGMDLIDDIPDAAELTARLRAEYETACKLPAWRNEPAGEIA